MKACFLALDLGNTSLHVGVFEKGKLLKEEKLPLEKIEEFASWWEKHFSAYPLTKGALASVNPKLTEQIRRALENWLGFSLPQIGEDIPYPLPLNVDHPRQVGADRVINAYMAREKYGCPCLVVDFGTAVTVDVVSEKGVYEGGIIAPGLGLSARSLFEGTALLPLAQVRQCPGLIGKNTWEAILSGIFWGTVGMVEFWVPRIQQEYGWEKIEVVATGGDSSLLFPHCPSLTRKDPHLTLEGIYKIGVAK